MAAVQSHRSWQALALDRAFIADPARIVSDSQLSMNVGGGFEGLASRRLAVSFDIRDHVISSLGSAWRKTPAGSDGIFFPVKGSVHKREVLAGVIFYFALEDSVRLSPGS